MNEQETNLPNDSEELRKDEIFTQRPNAKGELFDDFEHRTDTVLTSEGGISRKILNREREYGCGHDARRTRGGRCGEEGCFRDSCADCYTRCSACQVGLCLFHVRYLQNETGQKVPVCSHCRDTIQRRRFWGNIGALLLSPFVSFEDHSK